MQKLSGESKSRVLKREQYPVLNFYLPRNFLNTEIGGVDKACKKKGTSTYCSGYLIELLTILYSVTVYKSHKKVCQTQTSTCRDEILKNQPNKTGTTPQYFYTIPTSCAILPKLCVCICFLVVCRRGLSCRWKGVVWVCCA